MLWITLIFAAVATWAVLSLVAAEHCDRMNRVRTRLRESAEQAARRQAQSEQIPVIGGPSSQP